MAVPAISCLTITAYCGNHGDPRLAATMQATSVKITTSGQVAIYTPLSVYWTNSLQGKHPLKVNSTTSDCVF